MDFTQDLKDLGSKSPPVVSKCQLQMEIKGRSPKVPIMNENKTTLVDILLQVVVSLTTLQHIP